MFVDALKEYILQNWILLLILGAFIVILFITTFSNRRSVVLLLSLVASIFILSIVVFAEFNLDYVAHNAMARMILMAIRYSATPLIVALVILLILKRYGIYVFLPAIALVIIDVVSIFTGIVSWVDDAGNVIHGPIHFMPYLIAGLYMAFLIFLLIRRSNKRAIEIVPIVFLAAALSSGLIFPFIFGAAYARIFCSIIAVSLFIYYLFTILQRAKKDSLTGLLNRQAFYGETRRDNKDITAIVSVDMNGLKAINDGRGHSAGDEALSAIGLCISQSCRPKQSAYRMGGDEFIIVCRKTPKEEVLALVERIQKHIDETEYSCSIGYSCLEDGPAGLKELLKESDRKMYAKKAEHYKADNNPEE